MVDIELCLLLAKTVRKSLFSGGYILLHLPTQMLFPIGGERTTCSGSKLTNSLGRTKGTNSLGKQEVEFSTRR